jgi:hypothetical protein
MDTRAEKVIFSSKATVPEKPIFLLNSVSLLYFIDFASAL